MGHILQEQYKTVSLFPNIYSLTHRSYQHNVTGRSIVNISTESETLEIST